MALLLRDVQLPPPPSWWPLAPGWWLLTAGAVLALSVAIWLRRRAIRRRREVAALFDAALAQQATPPARIAIASEMLRRAARATRPDADRLEGEAWLRFLDARGHGFSNGPGRPLLDGAFRRTVDPAEADAVVAAARARFIELMGRTR